MAVKSPFPLFMLSPRSQHREQTPTPGCDNHQWSPQCPGAFCHCQGIFLALGRFLCLDWSPPGAGCVNSPPPLLPERVLPWQDPLGCAFGVCFVLFSPSFLLTEQSHQPKACQGCAWHIPAHISHLAELSWLCVCQGCALGRGWDGSGCQESLSR